MTAAFVCAAVILLIAAALALFRLVRGPSTLDRLVATETVVAILLCGLGTWAAYSKDSTVISALVVLALVGFVGSIGVARLRVPDER